MTESSDEPLVSLVTVARNAGKLIGETIASVADQTYRNIEYIVVDGASSDTTLDVVRANVAVTRWISEPDDGIYDAMNKGIALSTGRYVKLINADDVLPPDSVERAVDAFKSLPAGWCVYGDIRLMDLQATQYGFLTMDDVTRYRSPFLHPAWYVPASVYAQQGLYRTDFRISSDYEYNLRVRKAGVQFHHVGGAPLVNFRTNGASSSLRGVREGFTIDRQYQGLALASYAFSDHLYMKLRSRLLDSVLGERLALRLRTLVHERRRAKRGVNL